MQQYQNFNSLRFYAAAALCVAASVTCTTCRAVSMILLARFTFTFKQGWLHAAMDAIDFIGGIVSEMRCCSSDWNSRARNVGLNIVLGPIFYNVKIRQGACMHVDCRYPDTSQQTLTIIFKIRSLEFLYCEQNF